MKQVLFLLAAACSVMLLGSGCLVTGEPLAEKNEIKDNSLPGAWISCDSKRKPFYVEDNGSHYVVYMLNTKPLSFTTAAIKAADNSKSMKFISADITSMLKDDPDFPGGNIYMINAYDHKDNKLIFYELQDKSVLVKKLKPYRDKKLGRIMIPAADLRQLLAENMSAWEKYENIAVKAEIKNSRSGELFVALIKFIPGYCIETENISKLWAKGKISAEQAKQRKAALDVKLQTWRKKYAAANPALEQIIIKHLPLIDAAFADASSAGKCKKILSAFTEEYYTKAVQELLK